MKALRNAVVVAVSASSIALVGMPAHAAAAAVFHGTAHIDCFGCGVSKGTADLRVTGAINGDVLNEAPATASFTANEPIGVTCAVTGSASGTFAVSGTGTRVYRGYFNWQRVGATAVFTTSGDIQAVGGAVLVAHVTGLPCGTFAFAADVVGWLCGG